MEKAEACGDDRFFPGQGNVKDMDRDSLECGNARLREEAEIPKKAAGIFTTRRGDIPVQSSVERSILGKIAVPRPGSVPGLVLRVAWHSVSF